MGFVNTVQVAFACSIGAAIAFSACGTNDKLDVSRRSSAKKVAGLPAGSEANATVVPGPTGTPPAAPAKEDPPVFSLRVPTQRLAAGGYHTCATTPAGGLECWGMNDAGQLGTGDLAGKGKPSAVAGLGANVSGVAAGLRHTCAVMGSGVVRCWGSNIFGQLGDGTSTDSLSPKEVKGLSTRIISVETGSFHSCALDDQGSVFCWGGNRDGQLGRGDLVDSNTPVKVASLPGAVGQISAGRFHTCALTKEGKPFCWGRNTFGQLGVGDSSSASTPAPISFNERIITIAAGFVHTCALSEKGTLSCFGDNTCGQLATGTNVSSSSPTVIADGARYTVDRFAVGGVQTCFATGDGTTYCSGCNQKGTLGVGDQKDTNVPTKVGEAIDGAVSLAGGDLHSCARSEKDGKLWCWGGNERGQLGDGSLKDALKPILLGLLEGVE